MLDTILRFSPPVLDIPEAGTSITYPYEAEGLLYFLPCHISPALQGLGTYYLLDFEWTHLVQTYIDQIILIYVGVRDWA